MTVAVNVVPVAAVTSTVCPLKKVLVAKPDSSTFSPTTNVLAAVKVAEVAVDPIDHAVMASVDGVTADAIGVITGAAVPTI